MALESVQRICQTVLGDEKVCPLFSSHPQKFSFSFSFSSSSSSSSSPNKCILTFCHTVTKVKRELIHKAKVKKAYAKIKAREQENAPPPKTSQPVQDEAPAGADA